MSKEQELGLSQNRKKLDIREEYFVSPYTFYHFTQGMTAYTHGRAETQRCGRQGMGAQAHTTAQGRTRMGCATRRASSKETMNVYSRYVPGLCYVTRPALPLNYYVSLVHRSRKLTRTLTP